MDIIVMLAGEPECNNLIHSLLPRENVSEDTVLMLVSKISADLQSLKVCLFQLYEMIYSILNA